MTLRPGILRHLALAGMGVLALGACTDRSPVGSGRDPDDGTPGPPGGGNLQIAAVQCTADLSTETINCADPATAGGARPDIIVGGQNVYVRLSSSNVNYDAALGRFTFDVTLRNLIPQPMGTTDGTTLDPSGVRVFFHSGPNAPTGTVAVVGDGVGTFTATNQPYYQYNEVLSQYELSPAKQWRFDISGGATSFSFTLFVSAPVQFPEGWIDLQPTVVSMPALAERQVSAIVRTAVGNHDSTATVTWNMSDPSVASVTSSGLVTGIQTGTTAAQATSPGPLGGTRSGASTFNITGIKRYWKGAANDNWNDGANWLPVGVVPSSLDTAMIHGDSATVFPVMAQNNTVGGVTMQPGASVPSINVSSFDFTVTSSMDHGSTGLILGTGRMIFTGTAKTINGGLTNLDYRNARFLGSYSLGNNLNVTGGRIVVQGGRLRSSGYRVRVRPN